MTRRQLRERVSTRLGPLTTAGLPTLEEVRESLHPDEALVVTAAPMGELLRVCLRQHHAHVDIRGVHWGATRLDIRLLEAALTATHAPSVKLDSQFPAEASARLFGLLFSSLEPCLEGVRHLIWVPAAEFITLPIGVLLEHVPQRTADGFDLAAAQWLGKKVGVSYFSSIRGFVAARRLAVLRPPSTGFLGVGDPVLSGQTQEGTTRADAIARRGAIAGGGVRLLEELTETSRELTNIARILGEGSSRLLLREEASESRLRRQAIGQFRVLSLATHGLIQGGIPGLTEAALVLTPESDADSRRDGLLTASEIADLTLNADLVVLSACNTARYELGQFGVEVQGLAAAFAISGVPSTVAVLWSVESRRTEPLMTKFFGAYLSESVPGPAEALRIAMADALASARGTAYAHPRFWAPFIVLGDGRARKARTASQEPAKDVLLKRASLFIPTHVGEALRLLAIPQTSDYLVSGFADPVEGVFQPFLVRVTEDGRTVWAARDPETSAGKAVAVSSDALYVGALGMSQAIRFLPVVIKLSHAGQTLWRRVLSDTWQGPVIGLEIMPNGHLIAVSSLHREQVSGHDPRRLLIAEIAADGSDVRRAEVELPAGIHWAQGSMIAGENRIVIALTDFATLASGDDPKEKDLYDYRKLCSSLEETTIIIVDLTSLTVKHRAVHRGTRINNSARGASAAIVAAGARQASCAENARAVVFKVTDDAGLEAVFADDISYRSAASWLAQRPDDSYIVVGQSYRAFDVEQMRPGAVSTEFSQAAFSRLEQFGLFDGMVLWLNAQGGVIVRKMLAGGATTHFDYGALVGDRLIAVGAMGLEWLWTEYSVQPGR